MLALRRGLGVTGGGQRDVDVRAEVRLRPATDGRPAARGGEGVDSASWDVPPTVRTLVAEVERGLQLTLGVTLLVLTCLTCVRLGPLLWREQLLFLQPTSSGGAHQLRPVDVVPHVETVRPLWTGSHRGATSAGAGSSLPLGPLLAVLATSLVAVTGLVTAWRLLTTLAQIPHLTLYLRRRPDLPSAEPPVGTGSREDPAEDQAVEAAAEPAEHDHADDVDLVSTACPTSPPATSQPAMSTQVESSARETGGASLRSSHGEILFERRKHPRANLWRPCTLTWCDGAVEATTVDLSVGGALLMVPGPQAPTLHSEVTVSSLLPTGEPLLGRVLRRKELDDAWELALTFIGPTPAATAQLGALMESGTDAPAWQAGVRSPASC